MSLKELRTYKRDCLLGALGALLMLVGDLCLSVIPASAGDSGLFMREAYLNGSYEQWRLPLLLVTGLIGMALGFFSVKAIYSQIFEKYRKTRLAVLAGGVIYVASAGVLHFFIGSLADWTSTLAPLLEQTHQRVDLVLVGYLTGMGRDLMQQLGYPVDGIYYLPNLRMRFVESTLYPFIGGDTVRRSEPMPGGLQPSVNRILPYASPEYAEIGQDAAWELSLCCLENARDILLALETEYRALYARSLTLGRLSEAVILPLCPDKGGCMTYDINRAASTYLEGDIELLKRMKSIH